MSPDNKRVLKRYRVRAPRNSKTGQKQSFTGTGVDLVLEQFIEQFDAANPNHKYRLVALVNNKFRLVHEPPPPSTERGLPRSDEELEIYGAKI